MSSPRNAADSRTKSMVVAIPIPKRKDVAAQARGEARDHGYAATPSSSADESSALRVGSLGSAASASTSVGSLGYRRERLMSATFSKADYTVINIGEEERPRLITCIKASQGFDWNQEIFLPSYADYHFDDLERRPDPVEEIFVSDEEGKDMFPS